MTDMRVALVIPPVKDFYFTYQRGSFLGIHTLADTLSRDSIEYRIFNGVRKRGRGENLPPEMNYLSSRLGTQYFFNEYKRYGITSSNLASDIAGYGPDRVLISCFAFCYAQESIDCTRAIKHLLPDIPVYIGGPGPTVYPHYFLEMSPVDLVVIGEADDILADLLCDMPSERCIISRDDVFRKKDTISKEAHFRPVIVQTGENSHCRYYSTMVSRGCPRSCPYCSVGMIFPGFRKSHKPDNEKIFSGLGETNKKVHINFEDDNLLADFNYLASVVESVDKCSGGNYSISMENGIDFRYLDEERMELLKSWNITHLNLSMVSSDDDILRRQGRGILGEKFIETTRYAREKKIPVVVYMIAGLPGQSFDSAMDTLSFLKDHKVLIGISCYYPVPGTAGWEDKRIFNTIPPRLCTGSSFYQWNDIKTDDLISLFLDARRYNREKILF